MTTLSATHDDPHLDDDPHLVDEAHRRGRSRPDWLAGRPTSRGDVAIASAMGLVIIVIAYIFRSNIVPTDPWHYVRSGMHFPSTTWVPLGYTRYGIVIPSGVVGHVFGNAPIAYYFWPLLSSGVLTTAVALLARRFWGWPAAIVAVLLLVSNRVVFYNLTRGYPDIMSMAVFTVAVLCALLARDRLVRDQRATLLLLAVGFLLGWSFEVRETSLVAWPVVAAVLWRRGSLLRTTLLVSLPVLLWAALDIGVGAIAYGDPLLKLHVLSGIGGGRPTKAVSTASISEHRWLVGQSRWVYLSFVPRAALKTPGGIWIVALGALAVVGLILRNRGVRLMAAWFCFVYLMTVAPTGLVDPWRPRARIDVERYWIPFVPPAALAAAGLVAVVVTWLVAHTPLGRSGLTRGLTAAAAALAVCAGPVLFAAQYATTNVAFAPHGADGLEDLRDHLRGRSFHPKYVWTDWETARILPIYQHDFFGGQVWSGKPQSLTGAGKPQPGDYVVLFSATSKTCAFCRSALAPWLRKQGGKPPASWQREYVSPDGTATLYRVR